MGNVIIEKSKALGTVNAPPSKSMAHRLLILAGLADGESVIENIEQSDDVKATLSCLGKLGCSYSYDGNTVRITGTSPANFQDNTELFCNASGSTLRFFIPICMLADCDMKLSGVPSLMARPMDVFEKLFTSKGYICNKNEDHIEVRGALKADTYSLPGNVSSQFISGLLLSLALVKGNSTIDISSKIESGPYIDMTLEALRLFGVNANREMNIIRIEGTDSLKPVRLTVEGDYSNAAAADGFNLVGGDVKIEGLNSDSLQGDRIYLNYFEELKKGCPVLSLADCPDLGPVLFALAAANNGATFTEVGRLRIKESDRIKCMQEELSKLGISLTDNGDSVIIEKSSLKKPDVPINVHNDHRIVMAMTLLLSRVGGVIEGAEAVDKSWPSYFEVIKKLGIECRRSE